MLTRHEQMLADVWDNGKSHVKYVLSEIREEFISAPGTLLVGGWLLRAFMGPTRRCEASMQGRTSEVDVVFDPQSWTSPEALAGAIQRFGGERLPYPGRVEVDPPWAGQWRLGTRRLDLVNNHQGVAFLLGTDISLSSFGLVLHPRWLCSYETAPYPLSGDLYATESALQDLQDGVFQVRRETSAHRIAKMQSLGFRPRGHEQKIGTHAVAVPGWYNNTLPRQAHLDSSRNVALEGDRLVVISVSLD